MRIASVPYALRASDAETLGGRPASAYLLAPTAADGGTPRPAPARDAGGGHGRAAGDGRHGAARHDEFSRQVRQRRRRCGNSAVFETGGAVGMGTTTPFDRLHVRFTNTNGAFTGLAVQNLGNTATSYSGMLFYDQNGALGQFQGFNNVTHEYRINNIARHGQPFNGSINFMLGGASRLKIDTTVGTVISGPVGILAGERDHWPAR